MNRFLSVDSFTSCLGMWIALNSFEHTSYPLPPTARIVPFSVALWNGNKGGGDTTTSLDEIAKEQIGVRTPNNIASGRGFTNFGVVFHRNNQFEGCLDFLDRYGSVYHARNANNQRYSVEDSLEIVVDMFVDEADFAACHTEVGEPVKVDDPCEFSGDDSGADMANDDSSTNDDDDEDDDSDEESGVNRRESRLWGC